MGAVIRGSGVAFPDTVVTNADLEAIMDTSDEWIRSRTGVERRALADPGTGSSELGARAVLAALADAGVDPAEVDLLVAATMTPDHYAPGNAPLVQHKAGLGPIAAYDVRQQCAGFLYGLELADALLAAGRATTAVVVGAEVHAGYLPYGDSLAILRGERPGPPSADDRARATEARAWSVLFGDGAGAVVLGYGAADSGVLASRTRTDGSRFDLIHVPGLGFVHQPYVDADQLERRDHWPQMNGMELFRQAVTRMPEAVREVLDDVGLAVDDLDLVVAHQANDRILAGVRKALGLDATVVPSNIAEHGNTTSGTLPILFHEQRRAGAVAPGALVCFTAYGAGAHWGALLYREPA